MSCSNSSGTNFSDTFSKITCSSEKGKWEEFSNKTLLVYTSIGCEGRSKVNFSYSICCFKFVAIFKHFFFSLMKDSCIRHG